MKKKLFQFYLSKGVPKQNAPFYMTWLDKFIQFYNGSFDSVTRGDIWGFADKLDKEGYKGWQVRQAQEAISLYIQEFCEKKIIEDTQPQENGITRVSHVLTWIQAKEKFTQIIRLRHYAYENGATP